MVLGTAGTGKGERGNLNGAAVKAVSAGLLLLGVTVGTRVAAWPIVRIRLPDRSAPQSVPTALARPMGLDSFAVAAVAHDPFRITRRPATVEYDPLRAGQTAALTPPKPALMLVGIVWDGGSNPTALLEGVPGADGPRVVRRGEPLGALRVKSIDRHRVLIVGLDTTWALTVREPWK